MPQACAWILRIARDDKTGSWLWFRSQTKKNPASGAGFARQASRALFIFDSEPLMKLQRRDFL
ncbi:MAG TPA: hypothetical protein VM029_03385, partial [Opitutaceae bacterium]|nr:hypothetical protein [Opitutaceae bacterium]